MAWFGHVRLSWLCLWLCWLSVCPLTATYGQETNIDSSEWKGFQRLHFQVTGRPGYVVVPKHNAPGKPWIWRARFPGYHAEMDVELLHEGYHIAYVDVAGMFGNPQAVAIGDDLYDYVTRQFGLADQCVLEGVSRGGLLVYNWAVKNPEKVACIYCDTPVLDFRSWPGGKGAGIGSARDWELCKEAYGLSEEAAQQFANNPVAMADAIAKANIPLLHIVSENDRVVPAAENTYLLQQELKARGHALDVISVPQGSEQSHGHHFPHPDPNRVVSFIREHTAAVRQQILRDASRIVFLGDSITYHGQYVSHFDAWLHTLGLDKTPVVINMGLSSETVSGLSEEGHE